MGSKKRWKTRNKRAKGKGKGTDWPLSFCIFFAKQTFPNVQEALLFFTLERSEAFVVVVAVAVFHRLF